MMGQSIAWRELVWPIALIVCLAVVWVTALIREIRR